MHVHGAEDDLHLGLPRVGAERAAADLLLHAGELRGDLQVHLAQVHHLTVVRPHAACVVHEKAGRVVLALQFLGVVVVDL